MYQDRMQTTKRHVNNGENWAEDEEQAAAMGYRNKLSAAQIAKTFPTDRSKKSIRMKLGNHEWHDTSGTRGLSGGNAWVKNHWAPKDTYAEDVRAVEDELKKLEREERAISHKKWQLEAKRKEIEDRARAKKAGGLTKEEEKWLRDELTVVGEILGGERVLFGSLKLLDEDPDKMETSGYFGQEHSEKFSIAIDVGICTEFNAGLSCKVVVKTKVPQVEDIVREMLVSSEDEYEENPDPYRREWPINWDYYQKIILKKPYAPKI